MEADVFVLACLQCRWFLRKAHGNSRHENAGATSPHRNYLAFTAVPLETGIFSVRSEKKFPTNRISYLPVRRRIMAAAFIGDSPWA